MENLVESDLKEKFIQDKDRKEIVVNRINIKKTYSNNSMTNLNIENNRK
jgi:hypothetical protein